MGLEEAAREGCAHAARLGHRLLKEGAHALDVVERVVNALEDNDTFNSGTGSHANAEGDVEMDALIVDGATLEFGAVAGIRCVKNPVSVARAVMERTAHCFLAGPGATEFARAQGFQAVPEDLLRGDKGSGPEHGTVGAVALDAQGNVAAATSTGGTRDKLPGRVGDSPIIGCGALAENGVGGASATGHGESLLRVMMARTTAEYLQSGATAQEAADAALQVLKTRTGGLGGVICLDASGRAGFAFNTTHLAIAHASGDAAITVSL